MVQRLSLLILFCLLIGVIAKQHRGGGKYLDQTQIAKLIESSKNATRDKVVAETLAKAAGVYNDKIRGKSLGLEKTVFTTVIAFNSAGIFHYKVYFQNFLCFAKHYDFDIVVYIVHHHLPDVEGEIRSLAKMGVKVLTYPDELFWKLLATKKSNLIPPDKTRADYLGDVPTFQHHGALVMLVPTLEALDLGYNVIFFDVDIGLVQDPVPFLIQGDADFVTSLEPRACPEIYPTFSQRDFKWETAEPNTGVMHVRATASGRQLFRTWLEEIIDENVLNDQRVFDPERFNAIYTPNCNWNTSAVPTVKPARFDNATFCILSEIMFQNGMVAFTCSTKKAYREDWVIEMHERGTLLEGHHFPVTIHANYCNGKSHELNIRGLWLHEYAAETAAKDPPDLHEGGPAAATGLMEGSTVSPAQNASADPYAFSCKKYDVQKTYYATLNLTEEVFHIKLKREAIRATAVKNGTIIKRVGGHEVFLMDDKGLRHGFPNADTFEAMGFEWGQIHSIPTFVMDTIPLGDPLPKKDF